MLAALGPGTAFGQTQKPEGPATLKTKLEAFEAQTGAVIVRGSSVIGTVRGQYGTSIVVESKEFTNAATGKKEYGITIQMWAGAVVGITNISYIDYDEIESLLRGIEYIARIDKTATKFDRLQAVYHTRGDFEVLTYRTEGEVMVAISSGRSASATVYLRLPELPELRDCLAKAKAAIDAIRMAT
jgi:hypothetical protein